MVSLFGEENRIAKARMKRATQRILIARLEDDIARGREARASLSPRSPTNKWFREKERSLALLKRQEKESNSEMVRHVENVLRANREERQIMMEAERAERPQGQAIEVPFMPIEIPAEVTSAIMSENPVPDVVNPTIAERMPRSNILYRCSSTRETIFGPEPEDIPGNEGGQYLVGTERADDVRDDVIAENFHKCVVTHGMKTQCNGAFHYFFQYNRIIYDGFCQFNNATIQNLPFSTLRFNLSGKDHTTPIDNLERSIYLAQSLMLTGALAGMPLHKIKTNYKRFSLHFISTRGGHYENPVPGDLAYGMRFYSWSMSPFNIDDLFPTDEAGILQPPRIIIDAAEGKIQERLDADDLFGVSGDDNSDIPYFDDMLDEAKKTNAQWNIFRNEVIRRRMDECIIKLIPAYIPSPSPLEVQASMYQPRIIPPDTLLSELPLVEPSGSIRALQLRLPETEIGPVDEPFIKVPSEAIQIPQMALAIVQPEIHTMTDGMIGLFQLEEGAITSEVSMNLTHKQLDELILNPDVGDLDDPSNYIPPRPLIPESTTFQALDQLFNAAQRVEHEFGPELGQCIIDPADQLEESLKRLKHLYAPQEVEDNNCFLRCILVAKEWREPIPVAQLETLRNLVQAPDHLNYNHAQTFANMYGDIYHFWQIRQVELNEETKKVQKEHTEAVMTQEFHQFKTITGENKNVPKKFRRRIHILVYRDHCYLITEPRWITNKVKCSLCNQWIVRDNFQKHGINCNYCQVCHRAYSTSRKFNHQCEGARTTPRKRTSNALSLSKEKVCQDWVSMEYTAPPNRLSDPNRIWFADIEAFPDPRDQSRYIPYAIGLQDLKGTDKVKLFFGKDCMGQFLKACDAIKGMLDLVAYSPKTLGEALHSAYFMFNPYP